MIANVPDFLSFYKEELDGEQHNYCQMMSRVSERPPISVLEDVAREALSSAKVAEQILADSPAALKAFKDYVQGYMQVVFIRVCSASSSHCLPAGGT